MAKRFLWLIPIALAVALDQLTKYLAVVYLKPIGTFPIIQDVLHLTYVENRGAAFGMLKDHRWVFMLTSTVAIIAVLIFMFGWYKKYYHPLFYAGLALICGGGIGNMIDRTVAGYVVDFVDLQIINFAVWNGADTFITIGTGLVILYLIIAEVKSIKADKAAKKTE